MLSVRLIMRMEEACKGGGLQGRRPARRTAWLTGRQRTRCLQASRVHAPRHARTGQGTWYAQSART